MHTRQGDKAMSENDFGVNKMSEGPARIPNLCNGDCVSTYTIIL